MAKTKESKIQVLRINKVSDDLEEVFLYREDPYLNEVKYVKPGTYKVGEISEAALEKEEG